MAEVLFCPLAGINCNINIETAKELKVRFPSPCGDKLQRVNVGGNVFEFEFSSPYGDKPQLYIEGVGVRIVQFSPPYGDGDTKATKAGVYMTFSSPRGDKLQWQKEVHNV